jgi:soluble lytic murein transglycosylase
VWEATYPLPFRKLVERSARKAHVDPDLLQALMREESRFNPFAYSSTGAVGLTQLMPLTAARVAQRLHLEGPVDAQALRSPDLNIQIGGAYLGSLVHNLGSIAFGVAAYNAGPLAVLRWIEARADSELDAWVEEIPFAETRDYVKRVLGSYAAYQLTYRGATSALASIHAPVASRGGQ